MINRREELLVSINNLIKQIKLFYTKYNKTLYADSNLIQEKIKYEGGALLYNILEYKDFETYKNEYLFCIAWTLSFNSDIGNPEIIIANWDDLNESLKKYYINLIKENPNQLISFESIQLIRNNKHLNETEKSEMIDDLEILFNDYFRLIVSVDNNISNLENEKFELIKQLYKKPAKRKINEYSQIGDEIEDVLNQLNSLVGLENIKLEVWNLIKFIKVNQLRIEKGLPSQNISLHSVFYGPPGTGKTTIARLFARALKSIGILKSGHLVETERSQLVAGYTGQTAIKTMEVIEKSLDGVLFIDEAYSLINDDDQFGSEAINTLLKYMEDNRDRLVVIVAGYENEMTKFIESNTGLKSRFSKYFYFQNYKPSDLALIFNKLLLENSFEIQEELKEQILTVIKEAIIKDGNQFGNARFIRNYYEKVVLKQFARVHNIDNPSVHELQEIKFEDLII